MSSTLIQVDELSKKGRWQEAVDLLCAANRQSPDIFLERKLIDCRVQAHESIDWSGPSSPWAGNWKESHHEEPEVFEIDASELSSKTLAKGVLGHGAMVVRGLISADLAEELKGHIDKTIKAREDIDENDNSPWHYESPFIHGTPKKFVTDGNAHQEAERAKVKKGSIWVAESPRMMQRLIALYEQLGLRSVLSEYFGEPPSLSARKWVLRKIAPNAVEADWHQDGRFMGSNFHSVNLWLALSECGAGSQAAGMEIIPNQSREIYETGTKGAAFQWSVGKGFVEELKKELPVFHPHINPGDALFFDHYNLHRTAFREQLTESRYAIESWFFAASTVPAKQMPILF